MKKIQVLPRFRNASGWTTRNANPRIALTMQQELFNLVEELARHDEIPFAEEARRLMTIGLGVVLAENTRPAGSKAGVAEIAKEAA